MLFTGPLSIDKLIVFSAIIIRSPSDLSTKQQRTKSNLLGDIESPTKLIDFTCQILQT